MFSNRCLKIMSWVCFIVVNCGTSCVLYDIKTGEAYVTKVGKIRTALCMIVLTFSAIYGSLRTTHAYRNPTELNKAAFPICCIFTMFLTIVCVCSFITFIWLEDFRGCIGQNFRFAERFKRKWVTRFNYKKGPTGMLLEAWLILLIIFLMLVCPLCPLCFFFLVPQFPILPHTILPSPWNSYWVVIIPSIGACYIMTVMCCSLALGHITSLSVYFALVVPILTREFKGGRPTWAYRTRQRLRHVDVMPREYKALELLHRLGMTVYGKMLAPNHTLLGQFILLTNFTLIKQWETSGALTNLMLFGVSGMALCFWSSTLEVSGRFHKAATKTIQSWKFMKQKSRHDSKLMKRFRKSCRPLAIGFEQIFKIKRLTVLKFIRGVIKGTFRALLLSQRKH